MKYADVCTTFFIVDCFWKIKNINLGLLLFTLKASKCTQEIILFKSSYEIFSILILKLRIMDRKNNCRTSFLSNFPQKKAFGSERRVKTFSTDKLSTWQNLLQFFTEPGIHSHHKSCFHLNLDLSFYIHAKFRAPQIFHFQIH